jgi:serine/threonine protein kinase
MKFIILNLITILLSCKTYATPLEKLTSELIHTYKKINDKKAKLILSPNILGSGTFGTVRLAYRSGKYYAVKIHKPKYFKSAREEEKTHRYLQSSKDFPPSIIRLIGVLNKNPTTLYLVFPLYAKNLYQLLESTSHKGFSLGLTTGFILQLAEALCFLEQKGVIHGDLKPENILLADSKKIRIVLADFGIAQRLESQSNLCIQSKFYRAPEVCANIFPYSTKADLWSLACVFFELHTGEVLFYCTNSFPGFENHDQLDKIREVLKLPAEPEEEEEEEEAEPKAKRRMTTAPKAKEEEDLLGKLKQGTKERDLKKHTPEQLEQLYAQYYGLMVGLLKLDPEERPSAEDTLRSFKEIANKKD